MSEQLNEQLKTLFEQLEYAKLADDTVRIGAILEEIKELKQNARAT